jgi:hypothetical protein
MTNIQKNTKTSNIQTQADPTKSRFKDNTISTQSTAKTTPAFLSHKTIRSEAIQKLMNVVVQG